MASSLPTFSTASVPRVACPACAGPGSPFPTPLSQAPYFRCRSCELRFQEVPETEDGSIYAEVELPQEQEVRQNASAEARAASAAYYRHLDRDVLENLARATAGRRLLDVGSGTGRFLKSAVDAGFTCTGVDIAESLARQAQEHSGVPVHVGWLPDLQLPAASFDVVNLDFVLAYIREPLVMLKEVARILAPGGVCRVREFMADSVNGRVQRGNWWPYGDTTLRVYSRRSIYTLGQAAGLPVERCFPGTEISYATWAAWAARKKVHPLKRGYGGYWLKKASVLGVALAGDCAFYLRKRS